MEEIYKGQSIKKDTTTLTSGFKQNATIRDRSEPKVPKYRNLQHNFGEESKVEVDPGEDLSTVFGGVKKAMGKIEELRAKERERHRLKTLNQSSS
mmetsp:Transcript_32207/g.23781  ORF Transcript_32207/g.23781 Transcript_32207/m.23781 type:complete len:95 (+) Transcript_32207:395-679(+)